MPHGRSLIAFIAPVERRGESTVTGTSTGHRVRSAAVRGWQTAWRLRAHISCRYHILPNEAREEYEATPGRPMFNPNAPRQKLQGFRSRGRLRWNAGERADACREICRSSLTFMTRDTLATGAGPAGRPAMQPRSEAEPSARSRLCRRTHRSVAMATSSGAARCWSRSARLKLEVRR